MNRLILWLVWLHVMLFDREVWQQRQSLWRVELNLIKLRLTCLALRIRIWMNEL